MIDYERRRQRFGNLNDEELRMVALALQAEGHRQDTTRLFSGSVEHFKLAAEAYTALGENLRAKACRELVTSILRDHAAGAYIR